MNFQRTLLNERSNRPNTYVWIAISLLGIAAAFQMSFLIWRAGLGLEVDRNEAWNAWHIGHGLTPSLLYPDPGNLIINNYPPLSFIFINIASLSNDFILTGRIFSILSVIVIAACVADAVKTFGGKLDGMLVSSIYCLSMFSIVIPKYMGMNDPNFLALAVMMIGISLFLRSSHQDKLPVSGCLIIAIALFFKHSIIALPIAMLVWQFLTHRNLFLRSLGMIILLGALGLLICYFFYGSNFFDQLRSPRLIRLSSGFRFFRVIPPLLPALILWYRWNDLKAPRDTVLATKITISVCFVLNFVQQCGEGVDYNATFEFIIAVTFALGCALASPNIDDIPVSNRFRKNQGKLLVTGSLLIVLFGNRVEPYLYFFSTSEQYRLSVHEQEKFTNREVVRIQSQSGPVSCSVMTVCYLAGKSFIYDDFAMAQRVATGTWTDDRLKKEVMAQQVRFETISDSALWQSQNFASALR